MYRPSKAYVTQDSREITNMLVASRVSESRVDRSRFALPSFLTTSKDAPPQPQSNLFFSPPSTSNFCSSILRLLYTRFAYGWCKSCLNATSHQLKSAAMLFPRVVRMGVVSCSSTLLLCTGPSPYHTHSGRKAAYSNPLLLSRLHLIARPGCN